MEIHTRPGENSLPVDYPPPLSFSPLHPYSQSCLPSFPRSPWKNHKEGRGHGSINRPWWCRCPCMEAVHMPSLSQGTLVILRQLYHREPSICSSLVQVMFSLLVLSDRSQVLPLVVHGSLLLLEPVPHGQCSCLLLVDTGLLHHGSSCPPSRPADVFR